MAARALDAVEPALHELQGGADLLAQEIRARQRAARPMLSPREELRGVFDHRAHFLAAIVVIDRFGELAAQIDRAPQRAQIRARPAVRVDDAPDGRLTFARALDVRVAHVLARIVCLEAELRCRGRGERVVASRLQHAWRRAVRTIGRGRAGDTAVIKLVAHDPAAVYLPG